MRLWLVRWPESTGYDVYDAVVVAAESAALAIEVHPERDLYGTEEGDGHTWAADTADLEVTELGTAVSGTEEGVILASFNAG